VKHSTLLPKQAIQRMLLLIGHFMTLNAIRAPQNCLLTAKIIWIVCDIEHFEILISHFYLKLDGI